MLLTTMFVFASVIGASTGAHAQSTATERWSVALPGDPDGVAIATDAAGRKLVAVTINGGAYPPAAPLPGSLALLDESGTIEWMFTAGADINGEPAVFDVDGDGDDEFAVCESSETGHCYLIESDGSVVWAAGPFYYPSVWTAGPRIADVDADGSAEVVFATWGGAIIALDATNGSIEWSYDAWAAFGETFHSRVTLGNLDGDSALEVVAFGYNRGLVLVVDGSSGALQSSSPSLFDLHGNYGVGNTPTIIDLDGSGGPEILTNSVHENAGSGGVYALDASGNLFWRTTLPERLFWSGPIAADTNADGLVDVYVEGSNSAACRLRRLNGVDGSLVDDRVLGLRGWFQPFFALVDLDNAPDIVAAPFDGLDGVTGSFGPVYSYASPGGGIWRGASVDVDANGAADVFFTDWNTGALARVELTSPPPGPTDGGPSGGQLVADLDTLGDAAEQLLARLPGSLNHLDHAVEDIREAAAEAAVGKGHKEVLKSGEKALEELLEIEDGVDVDGLIAQLIDTMLYATRDYIERRRAITSDTDPAVLEAESLVLLAEAQFALGDPDALEEGVELLQDAEKEIRHRLEYESSNCPAATPNLMLSHECALVDVRDDVAALILAGSPGSSKLDKALDKLEEAIASAAEPRRDQIVKWAEDADGELTRAIDSGADAAAVNAVRASLAQAVSDVVNQAIVDVTLLAGEADSDVLDARAHLMAAEAHRSDGDYESALDEYEDAMKDLEDAVK